MSGAVGSRQSSNDNFARKTILVKRVTIGGSLHEGEPAIAYATSHQAAKGATKPSTFGRVNRDGRADHMAKSSLLINPVRSGKL